MKWTTNNIELLRSPLGVMVVIPAPHDNDLSKITADKEYTVEIKKKSKQRSLNANSYCWVLCQKIAKELSKNGYTSKEDVYKKAIRDCGIFITAGFTEQDKDDAITSWSKQGIGWFADDMGASAKVQGVYVVHLYKGSSVYNVEEMQRLIECLVDECHQLGIQLEDSDYIQSLVKEWGNEQTEKGR